MAIKMIVESQQNINLLRLIIKNKAHKFLKEKVFKAGIHVHT